MSNNIPGSMVLWLVDGALVLIFLMGASAAYLDPTQFWFCAAIAIVLPLVASLLLPFAFLWWRRRNRLAALIHVVLVIAVAPRHVSPERFLPRPQSSDDLALMTWNLPVSPESEEAAEKLTEWVRATQPDMIGMQENLIWATKQNPQRLRASTKFNPLIDSLGYSMHPPTESPPGKSYLAWYQPLLTRFEIDHQEQLSFQEEARDWPRLVILRTEFRWQERKVAHYNVHLTTHGKSKPWGSAEMFLDAKRWLTHLGEVRRSFQIRAWQVQRIRELIEEERYPVILSGDFNSTPDSWVYHRLSDGLQDAYRVAGSGWGATYHAGLPALRIDFVLLGPEFEAVSAEVPPAGPELSDHRPLVVHFRWRQPNAAERSRS